jgi:hypothetical protein
MSEGKMTFIDACLKGKAKPEDIDEWVEKWHDTADCGTLWDYLGMTGREYALWVMAPKSLNRIIAWHRNDLKAIEEEGEA